MIAGYELETYAWLYLKYGSREFPASALKWYFSGPMVKKVLHRLSTGGALERVRRGIYHCKEPRSVFQSFFEPDIPGILLNAEKEWAYSGVSAVEVWTDFAYVQRNWESSPYFIKVLEKDLEWWKKFFNGNNVNYYVGEAVSSLGHFVVILPVKRLRPVMVAGVPADSLESVVRFCVENRGLFEYPLAYLVHKYGLNADVSKEMLDKVKADVGS